MDGFTGLAPERDEDATVLDQAKEILRRGGHCKGAFGSGAARCILGAVAEAKFGQYVDYYRIVDHPRLANAIGIEAHDVLTRGGFVAKYEHAADLYLACQVNNAPETTRETAMAFLDGAKARLAGGPRGG